MHREQITYRELGTEQFDLIRPLWEQLKTHHVLLPSPFSERRAIRTFEGRKEELLAKAATGRLRVDVAQDNTTNELVGYCVTSLKSDGEGELDSLFVQDKYRNQGIGGVLTRRALEWLNGHQAQSKMVVVAAGNDPALRFYERFGFRADIVFLRQPAG